ncbi:MAG: DUF92 domain-containing protein [Thermoplasmata archaeon]
MIVPTLFEAILIAVLVMLLGTLSYYYKILNLGGSILSVIMGLVVGIFGSIYWLILLVMFVLLSYAATIYKFNLKKRRGVAEGKSGERGFSSVFANGLVPMIIALVPLSLFTSSLLYLTSLSAATSDTVASEFGVSSQNTYLITTFKRVRPGTNGGISLYGEAWSLAGAAIVSILGFALFYVAGIWKLNDYFFIIISTIIGFVGCQIDSVLGAVFENRNFLTKGQVNFLQISISTIIVYIIYSIHLIG